MIVRLSLFSFFFSFLFSFFAISKSVNPLLSKEKELSPFYYHET